MGPPWLVDHLILLKSICVFYETYCNNHFMNEMNWDDLRLFLAVARQGGLAAAAGTTGKSPPTLGRRMLALEASIGADLFRRLPKGYEMTEQGLDLLSKVTGLEAMIDPLANPGGKQGRRLIKISAGAWMTQVICAKAKLILGKNSHLALRFIAADEKLDIARREAVIGIRNHRPEEIGLACRKVGHVQFAGYAIDPSIEPWVRVVGRTPSALWLAANASPHDCLEVVAARNALDLAKAGVARALLPTFIGDAETALSRVTPPIADLAHDQWLVTHHEERFVPDIRQTIDRLHRLLTALHRRVA